MEFNLEKLVFLGLAGLLALTSCTSHLETKTNSTPGAAATVSPDSGPEVSPLQPPPVDGVDEPKSIVIPDKMPPDVTAVGFTFDAHSRSIKLSLTGAHDNVSSTTDLHYLLVVSPNADIQDLNAALAHGTLCGVAGCGDPSPVSDPAQLAATGLEVNQTYWIGVIVIDKAGNKAYVAPKLIRTEQRFAASVVLDSHFATTSTGLWFPFSFNGLHIGSCTTAVGRELCKFDPTTQKLELFVDINPLGDSSATPMGIVNGLMVFHAFDSEHGDELWVTDGTVAGTHMIKDAVPGRAGLRPVGVGSGYTVVSLNDKLYFAGESTGIHGGMLDYYDLWVTDGTAAGTHMVAHPNAVNGNNAIKHLTAFNGNLFFTADDGVNGIELWISDGTPAGSHMLKDVWVGSLGSQPQNYTVYNGSLYFTASTPNTNLFRSDGTAAGTVALKSFGMSGGSLIAGGLNGVLLLTTYTAAEGQEPWISDGTGAGTTLLKDVNPGLAGALKNLTVSGNLAFFIEDDGTSGE